MNTNIYKDRDKILAFCQECHKTAVSTTITSNFYKVSNKVFKFGEHMFLCKKCIKELSCNNESLSIDKFKFILQEVNRPYFESFLTSAISEMRGILSKTNGMAYNYDDDEIMKKQGKKVIGYYMKKVNNPKNFDKTWEDGEGGQINIDINKNPDLYSSNDWSGTWTPNEFVELDDLFNDYLQQNPELTSLSQINLVKRICMADLKVTKLMLSGDYKGYGDLNKQKEIDLKSAGLNSEDLKDRMKQMGINSFSQVSAKIEEFEHTYPNPEDYPIDIIDANMLSWENNLRRMFEMPDLINPTSSIHNLTKFKAENNIDSIMKQKADALVDENIKIRAEDNAKKENGDVDE